MKKRVQKKPKTKSSSKKKPKAKLKPKKRSVKKIKRSGAKPIAKKKTSGKKKSLKRAVVPKRKAGPKKVSRKVVVKKKKPALKPKKNVRAKLRTSKRGNPKSFSAKTSVLKFNPDHAKHDVVRQSIVTILWRNEHATLENLMEEVLRDVESQLADEFHLYFHYATEQLLLRGYLEPVPEKAPTHYRLVQRTE